MQTTKKREIPSLGSTGREIYKSWRELTAYPGEEIIGVALGGPMFCFHGLGRELQVSEKFRQPDGSYIATVRDPTEEEVDTLHEAIDRGWLQIEGRKRTGCLGVRPFVDAGRVVRIYHQSTGRPLPEWLETDEGQKWQRQEARRNAELKKQYPHLNF